MQVGRDPPALASEASIARASSRSRSSWPRCSRRASAYASGTWNSRSTSSAAEQRRRERAQEPRGARAHRAEALVGLEQHRRAVGRADRRVRLQQLALLALVAVLGLGQVAELGVGAAGREQLRLLVAEREALPDQPRLVGVEDRPSVRHSFTRTTDSPRIWPWTRSSSAAVRRVAVQHAVGQRRLDEPPFDLDALARVALGLRNVTERSAK